MRIGRSLLMNRWNSIVYTLSIAVVIGIALTTVAVVRGPQDTQESAERMLRKRYCASGPPWRCGKRTREQSTVNQFPAGRSQFRIGTVRRGVHCGASSGQNAEQVHPFVHSPNLKRKSPTT